MRDVLPQITEWTARGDRIAIATVVGVKRSAPRPPGAKMAVNDRGEMFGAVSGGCVEGAVVVVAETVLGDDEPQLLHFGIADDEAWDVGLPCGGEIDVWVQVYEPGRFEEVARAGGRAAEITMLEGARPGAKLLVEADGERSGTLGSPEMDDEAARTARRTALGRAVRAQRSAVHRRRRTRRPASSCSAPSTSRAHSARSRGRPAGGHTSSIREPASRPRSGSPTPRR